MGADGGPAGDLGARRMRSLVDVTGADELMVTTMVADPAARLRTYELLAGTFA